MEHQYEKPWIVLMLLGKLALAGEADKTFEPAHGTVCAVSMRDWLEDTTLVFYSLHPCAQRRSPRTDPAQPARSHPTQCAPFVPAHRHALSERRPRPHHLRARQSRGWVVEMSHMQDADLVSA